MLVGSFLAAMAVTHLFRTFLHAFLFLARRTALLCAVSSSPFRHDAKCDDNIILNQLVQPVTRSAKRFWLGQVELLQT